MLAWQRSELTRAVSLGGPCWLQALLGSLLAALHWIVSSLISALGLLVGVLLAVSDFRLRVFMAHLENLAGRYAQSDIVRQGGMDIQMITAFLAVTLLVMAVRTPALLRAERAAWQQRQQEREQGPYQRPGERR